VQTWVTNAEVLEDDIARSRSMANEIVRRSEAPDVSGQTIREAEEKVMFLQREVSYNSQVQGALIKIKEVNQLLDEVEQARDDRKILESLRLLESRLQCPRRVQRPFVG
jgi:protein transport protein DSL1/ZW10